MVDTEVPLIPRGSLKKSRENRKMNCRKRWLLLVALIVLTLLGIGVYILKTSPEFNQYALVRRYGPGPESESESKSKAPRTILLWNSFFGNKRWGLPEDTLGPAYFRDDLQCPVYRCELTNVHHFLPEVEMFDAILFHTAQPFPLLNSVPQRRNERQLYVFALMEPPGETKHVLNDEHDFYNLTMTYRLDSDIVWPYQYILDESTDVVVAPQANPHWRQPATVWNDTQLWTLLTGKKKLVAWFVSHCETLSKREQLAAEMSKFIDVDIYGKCGTKSCPRGSDACDQMLDNDYKFYLSFENALCTDYISEKFFNALKRQIVPIVFGGANYTRFAPPHSYIDAENFANVEELATYIKYLDTHPAEYMRYFWWRKYYRLGYRSPYCELCEKLHSATVRHKTQTYRNIEDWWIGSSCRFKANIEW